jgi:hypothetical protein
VNSLLIAGIVFACTFGGALAGLWLRGLLPEHHLSTESRDAVKLGTGVVGTMAALVIGLLIGAAKADFDAQKNAFQQMSTNLVLLDRALAHYGPEAKEARAHLHHLSSSLLDHITGPPNASSPGIGDEEITANGGVFYDSLRDLKARDDSQRSIQSQILQIAADLARARVPLTQRQQSSIPAAFLVVLAFWLTIIFLSFGLLTQKNATVLAVFFVCALSVSGAIFLIVDLDQPFEGLIQVSADPLRSAVSQLGQ